jgi:hypothetical protein
MAVSIRRLGQTRCHCQAMTCISFKKNVLPSCWTMAWLRFVHECARPALVFLAQVEAEDYVRTLKNTYRDVLKAVVFATRNERMMGRCASVVNGCTFMFATIADARVTAMRLARVVLLVQLAIEGAVGGTDNQKKLAVWGAVRERINGWPISSPPKAPDLRLLAMNAPEPIVVAEDGRSVSVAGGLQR